MLGKALEAVFIRVWVVVKLNLFFWLYSAAGGFVFGIGPALKTVSELFASHEFEYKELTLREGWQLFKKNFARGNGMFWLFAAGAAGLAYNLFLSLQVKGLLFVVIDFVLLFGLLYLFASFQFALFFDGSYEISFANLIKLSFISSLSSFSTFLKMMVGSAVILGFTWQYKGLILFGVIALLLIWNYYATRTWRTTIEGRLEAHE